MPSHSQTPQQQVQVQPSVPTQHVSQVTAQTAPTVLQHIPTAGASTSRQVAPDSSNTVDSKSDVYPPIALPAAAQLTDPVSQNPLVPQQQSSVSNVAGQTPTPATITGPHNVVDPNAQVHIQGTVYPSSAVAGSQVAGNQLIMQQPGLSVPVTTSTGARQRHPNILWQYGQVATSQSSIQSNPADRQTAGALS